MIPNEVIMTSFVENYTVRENWRTEIMLSIQLKTPKVKVERAVTSIKEILGKYKEEGTVEKYRVNFDKFWTYSLDIFITYFSLLEDYEEYLGQKEAINYMIKTHFKRQGIKLAMPTRNMVISKKKKNKNKTKNKNNTHNNEVTNTHNELDVPKRQWSAEIEISTNTSLVSKAKETSEKYDVESQIDI